MARRSHRGPDVGTTTTAPDDKATAGATSRRRATADLASASPDVGTDSSKAATGRPSTYDPDIAAQVLDAMALHGLTCTRACAQAGVPKTTFLGWVTADRDGLSDRYARARAMLLEHWADDVVDIADDAGGDYVPTPDGPVFVAEHVQRSRLRSDNRRWLLSKLVPETYGDRQTLRHEGSVDVRLKAMSDDDLTARAEQLAAAIAKVASGSSGI